MQTTEKGGFGPLFFGLESIWPVQMWPKVIGNYSPNFLTNFLFYRTIRILYAYSMTTIIKPAEYVELSKLKGSPNNPRSITEDAFKKLTKSIENFSIMLEERPLLARKIDGVILCGNMRFLVAKKLGMKAIPVKWIEGYTPEQEKELVIRDNIDFGDWDFDLLSIDYDLETLQDYGLEVPNFTASNEEEEPKEKEESEVQCPSCNKIFNPSKHKV